MLTNEETKEKYKELKEYHIDNLFQKYVKTLDIPKETKNNESTND